MVVDYFGSFPGDGSSYETTQNVSTPTGSGYWIIGKMEWYFHMEIRFFAVLQKKEKVTGNIKSFKLWSAPDHSNHDSLFDELVQNDFNQL